jgi:hypothetical protein
MNEMQQLLTLATFGVVSAVLMVSHNIADHVLGQTDRQAAGKGAPSPEQVAEGANPHAGWGACLAHVGQYHLVMLALLGLADAALPLTMSWAGMMAGLGFSAVTHAFLDRRWPVRWLLRATGSPEFAQLSASGLNGMYLADQALHALALLVATGLITLL